MKNKSLLLLFLCSLFFIHSCYQNAEAQNDIIYVPGSTKKIEQFVGDYDRHFNKATANKTGERYGVHATDLGVPFEHKGKTYVAFGDIPPVSNDRDPLAYTNDANPEDGISLEFVTNSDGKYRPIEIPGVSQKGFEVPMEGVSWGDTMYIYHTTDVMGRSVVAKSTDDGYTFTKLYDLSSQKFINVSLVKTKSTEEYPEPEGTDIQVMLGSGKYRQSDAFLAYQRGDQIEEKSLQYFTGLENGLPVWSAEEAEALPLFNQSCVGELSLSFNKFINKWILLYNCGEPRGINCRTADNPWGPWSDPFVIFNPHVDKGYCFFIHSNWEVEKCDNVHDPGRENQWGGEYGPYQFENLATGNEYETTIYYTLSTWNPYTVVLMKSKLRDTRVTPTVIQNELPNHFKLYPNPSVDKLVMEFRHNHDGISSMELLDLQGRKLKEEQVRVIVGDNRHEIMTRDMPAGLYFIKIKLPKSTETIIQKIMVNN